MINLAPFYYKNLLDANYILENPEFLSINLLDGSSKFQSTISLKPSHRPSWLKTSNLYKDCDGTGTDKFKNVAVYKAISEALERFAFYESVETKEKEFCFDLNPTTTGMAAYPFFTTTQARNNGRAEAVERWAIHEFNRMKLPIKNHQNSIPNLNHFELVTPFKDIFVSLLCYKKNNTFFYGFAGGKSLAHSLERALIELDRNIHVLSNDKNEIQTASLVSAVDKTLVYFSTEEGNNNFQEKILRAPPKIQNLNPRVLCDKEIRGDWTKYTRVWRYLLEDSYFPCHEDKTFFMF